MRFFGMQKGFDGRIRVGLLDQGRKRFLGGEDIIDLDSGDGELMPGIAEYLENFDGAMQIAYNDGPTFRINVEKFPDEETAARAEADSLEYAVVAERDGQIVALSNAFDTREQAEDELTKLRGDDYYRDQNPFVADRSS